MRSCQCCTFCPCKCSPCCNPGASTEAISDVLQDVRNKGVSAVVLSGQGISELPDEFAQCSHVTTLDLKHNKISSLPESIGQLKACIKAFLQENRLPELPPLIQELDKLLHLDAADNHITHLPMGVLPASLTKLLLDRNRIANISLGVCQALPNLQELRLGENRLEAIPEDMFALKALETLDLSGNQLHELPESIDGLTALRELDVSRNKLTTLPPSLGRLAVLLRRVRLSPGNAALAPELQELCKQPTGSLMRHLQIADGRLPVDDDIVTAAAVRARCSKQQVRAWSEEFIGLATEAPAQPPTQGAPPPPPSSQLNLREEQWTTNVVAALKLPAALAARVFYVMHWARPGVAQGVALHEYLSAMCVLSCGTPEERAKFLFRLLDVAGGVLRRESVLGLLQGLLPEPQPWEELLGRLFGEASQLSFKQFCEWACEHLFARAEQAQQETEETPAKQTPGEETPGEETPGEETPGEPAECASQDLVDLSPEHWKWSLGWMSLFGLDPEQEQAGGPFLGEIGAMELKLKRIRGAGKLSRAEAEKLCLEHFPGSELVVRRVVDVLDNDANGVIDPTELVCALVPWLNGSAHERNKLCFRLFDVNGDGNISYDEMLAMLNSLWKMELVTTPASREDTQGARTRRDSTLSETARMLNGLFEQLGKDKSEGLNYAEFAQWAEHTPVAVHFMDTIKHMVHLDLGMRPSTPAEESALLVPETQISLTAGGVLYLVDLQWWDKWAAFAAGHGQDPGTVDNSTLVDEDGALVMAQGAVETQCKLISEEGWHLLKHWYGASPAVSRHIVTRAGGVPCKAFIDYFPLTFTCSLEKDLQLLRSEVPVSCSKALLVGELLTHAAKLLDVKPHLCRLWSLDAKGHASLLCDLEVSLEDSLLQTKQRLIVEMEAQDGVWGRVEDYAPGMLGLVNLGNTCYLNSALQCLSNVGSLREYFLTGQHTQIILDQEHMFQLQCQRERSQLDAAIAAREAEAAEHPEEGGEAEGDTTALVTPVDEAAAPESPSPDEQAGEDDLPGRASPESKGGCACFGKCACCQNKEPAPPKPLTAKQKLKQAAAQEEDELVARLKREALGGYKRRWVAEEFGHLMHLLWSDPGKQIRWVEPKELLAQVRGVNPDFEGSAQQDSQELLMTLLSSMHEALNQEIPEVAMDDGQQDDQQVAQGTVSVEMESHAPQSSEDHWEAYQHKNNSIVSRLMHGFSKITHSCDSCHHQSSKYESFLFYSVSVPQLPPAGISATVVYNDPERIRTRLVLSPEDCRPERVPQVLEQVAHLDHSLLVTASLAGSYIHHLHLRPEQLRRSSTTQTAFYELPRPLSEDCALVRVLHRKIENTQYLLLPPFRAQLMGHPLLLLFEGQATSGRELYQAVLGRVRRVVYEEHLEGVLAGAERGEYPFELKKVTSNGAMCSQCKWSEAHCLGCLIPADESAVQLGDQYGSCTIAIDWQLKYFNSFEEAAMMRHESVAQEQLVQSKSYPLVQCIQADSTEAVEYTCSQCTATHHTIRNQLQAAPDVLAVHLKRFETTYENGRFTSRKIETMVDVPLEDLDLSSFVVGEADTRYNLVGVVNHKGHLGAGHYIAYAKHQETGKWLCYNDRVCSEIAPDQVVTPMAYVMFFQKVGAPMPCYTPTGLYQPPSTGCLDSFWCALCRLQCCFGACACCGCRTDTRCDKFEKHVDSLVRK